MCSDMNFSNHFNEELTVGHESGTLTSMRMTSTQVVQNSAITNCVLEMRFFNKLRKKLTRLNHSTNTVTIYYQTTAPLNHLKCIEKMNKLEGVNWMIYHNFEQETLNEFKASKIYTYRRQNYPVCATIFENAISENDILTRLGSDDRTNTFFVLRVNKGDDTNVINHMHEIQINMMLQLNPWAYSIMFNVPNFMNIFQYNACTFKGKILFNCHQQAELYDCTTVENLNPNWIDSTNNTMVIDSSMYLANMQYHHNVKRMFGKKDGLIFDYWLLSKIVKEHTDNVSF